MFRKRNCFAYMCICEASVAVSCFYELSRMKVLNVRELYLGSSMSIRRPPVLNGFAGSAFWVWGLCCILCYLFNFVRPTAHHTKYIHLTVRELWTLPGSQQLCRLGLLSPVTVLCFCLNIMSLLSECEGTLTGVIHEPWMPPGSQWLCKFSLLSPVAVFHQTSDLFCVCAAWGHV